jgi:hypothetical protein
MSPRHSTASASLLRSLCGNSVISVVNPSSLRFLSFELSTFDFEPPCSPFPILATRLPQANSALILDSLRFLNLKLKTDNCGLPKPNHSRTYARRARKSNHSRTYAKTGGWGRFLRNAFANNPFVFFHHVNHCINCHCRRADISMFACSGHLQVATSRWPLQGEGTGCRFRNLGATRLPLFSRLHL